MENYEPVKSILDKILQDNEINNKVILSYGRIIGCPEEFAIYHKKLGWYYYMSDEKNIGFFKGPYDMNALIQIITYEFPLEEDIADDISDKYPSPKLENYEYIDYSFFKSEKEIDAFESSHPEKKVE